MHGARDNVDYVKYGSLLEQTQQARKQVNSVEEADVRGVCPRRAPVEEQLQTWWVLALRFMPYLRQHARPRHQETNCKNNDEERFGKGRHHVANLLISKVDVWKAGSLMRRVIQRRPRCYEFWEMQHTHSFFLIDQTILSNSQMNLFVVEHVFPKKACPTAHSQCATSPSWSEQQFCKTPVTPHPLESAKPSMIVYSQRATSLRGHARILHWLKDMLCTTHNNSIVHTTLPTLRTQMMRILQPNRFPWIPKVSKLPLVVWCSLIRLGVPTSEHVGTDVKDALVHRGFSCSCMASQLTHVTMKGCLSFAQGALARLLPTFANTGPSPAQIDALTQNCSDMGNVKGKNRVHR